MVASAADSGDDGWRWRGDGGAGGYGGVLPMATVVAAGANKGGGAWRRLVVDLIDRATGRHFSGSPENFSGGGSRPEMVVAGRWPASGEGERVIGMLFLMLTNKGWIDGNGSNPCGGFRKPGGGRETRGGEDGLEGPGGQLSMVVVQHGLVSETHLVMMKRCSVCFCYRWILMELEVFGEFVLDELVYGYELARLYMRNVKKMVFDGDDYKEKVNSRKDGASLSSDDKDEEEMTEGEAIFFPFSLLGFLEMSRGSMTCS
nr:hypothetical protein [Tanacetum cinerariifolium]